MGLNNHNYDLLFINLIKLYKYEDKIREVVTNSNYYDCDSPMDEALDYIHETIFTDFCDYNNLNPKLENLDKANQYWCDCLNEKEYFDIQTYIAFLNG